MLLVERRIVERHGENHVGTDVVVAVAIHTIVAQVAELVVEHGSEVVGTNPCIHLQILHKCRIIGIGKELGGEHQRVVPQRIELYDVACARYDGPATLVGTVHPGDSLVASFAIDESVGTYLQVGMLAFHEPLHDVVDEAAVLLHALLGTLGVGILLQAPYGPQEHIGMLHLCNAHLKGFTGHEMTDGLLGCLHHIVVFLQFVVGEGESGKRDEHIACTALEPWVACQNIVLMFTMNEELVCAVDQSVIEVVSGRAHILLIFCQVGQCGSIYLVQTGRENHALALVQRKDEVAGHVQILVASVSSLLLLGVFQPAVPVWLIHELVLLVELHEQFGIARIHARLDAILHFLEVAAGSAVLIGIFPHASEGEEGLEPHRCGAM